MQLYRINQCGQKIVSFSGIIHSTNVNMSEETTYTNPQKYVEENFAKWQVLASHESDSLTFLLFEVCNAPDSDYHAESYMTIIFMAIEEAKWTMKK